MVKYPDILWRRAVLFKAADYARLWLERPTVDGMLSLTS
jgi:hypothetical protein